MRRKAVFVSLLLLSLSATAAISDPQCDQASTVAVAHLRLAQESRNAMNRSAFNEKCRVVFTQFVEAVVRPSSRRNLSGRREPSKRSQGYRRLR
jgi:hypothetical protein